MRAIRTRSWHSSDEKKQAYCLQEPNIDQHGLYTLHICHRVRIRRAFWHSYSICTLTPYQYLSFIVNTSLRSSSLYHSPSVCRRRTLRLVLRLPQVRISFLGEFRKLRKATISFVMSICPSAWNNSAPTGRIFMKLDIWVFFFENLSTKIHVSLKSDKNNGTLHEDVFMFMTVSRWIILRMKHVSNKSCREKQNIFYVQLHFCKNLAVYKIISKNLVEPERTQKIWRLRVAYWISKSTRARPHGRPRISTPTHPSTSPPPHTHTLIAFHGSSGFVMAP
jgi:hypothetical protein